eukprot:CFRG0700T1
MQINMPSLMRLVGLLIYLTSIGSRAAPAEGVVYVVKSNGELNEISTRERRTHSLNAIELAYLEEVTDDVASEEVFEFESEGEAPSAIDEFSVKLSESGECRINIHSTDGALEWVSNINAVSKSMNVSDEEILEAHAGFIIAALAVEEHLDSAILTNCGTPDILTFLGHSRGGAIANILAAMYYRRGGYEIKLVTWGSPRTFTTAWADYYQGKFYQVRVVNGKDVVTTVPPSWFGYKHYGTVVCLDCNDTSQDAEGEFSVNILNHLMYNYKSRVSSI